MVSVLILIYMCIHVCALCKYGILSVQWNPSTVDTVGPSHYSEVSLTEGSCLLFVAEVAKYRIDIRSE